MTNKGEPQHLPYTMIVQRHLRSPNAQTAPVTRYPLPELYRLGLGALQLLGSARELRSLLPLISVRTPRDMIVFIVIVIIYIMTIQSW